jgi:ribosomal protein S17
MENKRKNLSGRVVSNKMNKTVVVAVESTVPGSIRRLLGGSQPEGA